MKKLCSEFEFDISMDCKVIANQRCIRYKIWIIQRCIHICCHLTCIQRQNKFNKTYSSAVYTLEKLNRALYTKTTEPSAVYKHHFIESLTRIFRLGKRRNLQISETPHFGHFRFDKSAFCQNRWQLKSVVAEICGSSNLWQLKYVVA